MAKSVLQIVIETLKKGNGDKEAISTLKSLQGAISQVGAVVGAAAGAYVALDQTLGAAVRSTVAYATSVRELKVITGASAQEASKMVQIFGDYGISVEKVAAAQKKLSESGRSIDLATVAALADQYNALGSAAERTQFLVDNLGKGGMAFAEIFERGGDAIRNMGDAVDEGLVLTEKQIRAAKDYELALDNLKDAWDAGVMETGTKAIPVLTQLINILMKQREVVDEAGGAWTRYIPGIGALREAYLLLAKTIPQLTEQQANITTMEELAARQSAYYRAGLQQTGETLEEYTARMKAGEAQYRSTLSLVKTLTDTNRAYENTMADIAAKTAELTARRAELLAMPSRSDQEGAELDTIQQKLGELAAAEEEAASKRKESIMSTIGSLLMEREVLAGNFDAAMRIGVAFGVIDEKSALLATTLQGQVLPPLEEARGYYEYLANGGTATFEVYVKGLDDLNAAAVAASNLQAVGGGVMSFGGVTMSTGAVQAQWTGGRLGDGWTLVGDDRGKPTQHSELISPDGYVFNAEQTRALLPLLAGYKSLATGGALELEELAFLGKSSSGVSLPSMRTVSNLAYATSVSSMQSANTTSTSTGGGYTAATVAASTAVQAVAPVAEAVSASAQSASQSAQASENLAAQISQSNAVNVAQNAQSLQELRAIRQLLQRNATELPVLIKSAIEGIV